MSVNPEPLLTAFDVYKRLFGKDWIKKRNRHFFTKEVKKYMDASRIHPDRHFGTYADFRHRSSITTLMLMPIAGSIMEHIKAAMDEVGNELQKTTETVQGFYNELLATHEVLAPNIVKLVTSIRDKRTAMVVEVNRAIVTMKDVRQFFLDKDHKVEMERLKEFVDVCERMQKLIENGTLSAVSDIILKLEGV